MNLENRIFHDEWTDNYAFILPSFINAKPTCLICTRVSLSACKEYNRQHHETKHANFKVAFPQKTEAQKHKIKALKGAYAHSNRIGAIIIRQSMRRLRILYLWVRLPTRVPLLHVTLTLFPVTLFSYPVNRARKGPKKKKKIFGRLIIVVGDTPSSVETNAGGGGALETHPRWRSR